MPVQTRSGHAPIIDCRAILDPCLQGHPIACVVVPIGNFGIAGQAKSCGAQGLRVRQMDNQSRLSADPFMHGGPGLGVEQRTLQAAHIPVGQW